MKKQFNIFLILLIAGAINLFAQEKIPAFPGAEGFGKYVTGGRGGRVVYVTHLKDNNDKFGGGYKGSLRAALETSGSDPITIVFNCGGVIAPMGAISCSRSNITIAGQTALGDGICVKGYGIKFSGQNIIIRHMRFRVGDEIQQDDPALTFSNGKNAIFDHCSFSWSIEENVNITDVDSVTLQWCMNTESLFRSTHSKGDRGYAAQWGGEHASYHHNLLAHHNSRMPRQNGNTSNDFQLTWDYRNNVHYNWGNTGAFYGGGVEQKDGFSHTNLINNYFKPGPSTTTSKAAQYFCAPSGGRPAVTGEGSEYDFGYGLWYLDGNVMYDNEEKTNVNKTGLSGPSEHHADTEFEAAPVTTTSANDAYFQVLNNAGATKPKRDAIDTRIVNEVYNGSATFGGAFGENKGIIDGISDLKPEGAISWDIWDNYTKVLNSEAPLDTDEDGIPDEWEDANSLDKNNADDGKVIKESGYSNLEIYLNELAGDINTSLLSVSKINNIHVNVYPNPANDFVNVQSNIKILDYKVYSVTGQLVITDQFNPKNADYKIKTSGFHAGIYNIVFRMNDGSIKGCKVIIK